MSSYPGIKIKKEKDYGMEVALSIGTLQGHETYAQELSQCIHKYISQGDLREITFETEMLTDILEWLVCRTG